MNRLKLLFLLIPLFLLSACTAKKSEDELYTTAKAKIEEAKKLEADNKPDDAKKAYSEGIEMLKQLIADYPSSAKVPDAYNEIAKIYVDNFKDYQNAIKYYKELSDKFPQAKESKYAMFMVAFIYDEMLKDKEMAKQSYQKFLEKYPTDENPNEKMSESAKMMLQMLQDNRSIEDIIKNNTSNVKDSLKVPPVKKDTLNPKDKTKTNKTIDQSGPDSTKTKKPKVNNQ